VFGPQDPDAILAHLQEKQGQLRKSIASKTKLKYNPMLIFSLDPSQVFEKNIDDILEKLGRNEE
jgi:ribosome-binding factor A